ncbi:hypothetical protein P7K49_001952, partial [Saguinus oedipus]
MWGDLSYVNHGLSNLANPKKEDRKGAGASPKGNSKLRLPPCHTPTPTVPLAVSLAGHQAPTEAIGLCSCLCTMLLADAAEEINQHPGREQHHPGKRLDRQPW